MTTDEARRQLAAPPAPNVMGQDRFQIIERRAVYNGPSGAPPVMVIVTRGPLERF